MRFPQSEQALVTIIQWLLCWCLTPYPSLCDVFTFIYWRYYASQPPWLCQCLLLYARLPLLFSWFKRRFLPDHVTFLLGRWSWYSFVLLVMQLQTPSKWTLALGLPTKEKSTCKVTNQHSPDLQCYLPPPSSTSINCWTSMWRGAN